MVQVAQRELIDFFHHYYYDHRQPHHQHHNNTICPRGIALIIYYNYI